MIYLGATPLKAFKGEYGPANIYFGSTKITGWHNVSRLGDTLTFSNTYNDTASVLIYGKCTKSGTPALDTPITITSASGSLLINSAAVLDIPTLRAIEIVPTASVYTYELGGHRYIADSFNPATGEHIQRIGVKIFNGTEGWEKWADNADYIANGSFGYYWYTLPVANETAYNQMISTHFKSVVITSNYAPGYISRRGAATTLTLNVSRTIATGVDMKAWVAAQNTAGTPVTFYYPLASPVTSTLTSTVMHTYSPNTTFTTDGTVKPDLSITAKER